MKSYDLDSVLRPYANDQPKISMECTIPDRSSITRMPLIATPEGINEKFQIFFNCVVFALSDPKQFSTLYKLTDKSISEDDFMDLFNSTIGEYLSAFYATAGNRRGLDIELNLGRFEKKHRNLIGGLYVITYRLCDSQFEGISKDTQLEQKYAELLFTYKDDDFVLISNLTAFKNAVEE